jgi:SAM-dependent methyltransferase
VNDSRKPPTPDSETRVGRHYRGTRGADYFAYQSSSAEFAPRLEARKFLSHVRPTHAVVDFGCGDGSLLDLLPGRVKVGIEVNPAAQEAARSRGLTIVPSAADVEDGFADVVISNHALEHVLAPVAELRELLRILKPGGTLVIWLPLDDWRTQRTTQGSDPDHHLYAWTPRLIRNLLEEAGFSVTETRVVTHAWPPFTRHAARLPPAAFDAIAFLWSLVRRRRQLAAVASR